MMNCSGFEYVTTKAAIKAIVPDKFKGDRKKYFMDYLNSEGKLKYVVTKITVH